MIFIVYTCGDIPKEELIELQERLEAEANSPNKNKVMCLPRFATIASIDDCNLIKAKVTMNTDVKTTSIGFKPSELGKQGETMSKTAIKDMVELPDISIHFIAIGPGTNK